MNPEDTVKDIQEPDHDKTRVDSYKRPLESITKIADLQRMNVEQLNHFARDVGLKVLEP